MLRSLLRFGAVAFGVSLISACSGSGSQPIPPATPQLPTSSQQSAQADYAVDGVPQTSVNGVAVTVHLPLRNSDQLDALIAAQTEKSSGQYHQWLTPAQFRQRYGPTAGDVAAVKSTLQSLGFQTHVTSQSVIAAAPQSVVERAFNIKFRASAAAVSVGRNLASVTQSSNRTVLTADRAPTLPSALVQAKATVGFTKFTYTVDSQRISSKPLEVDNRYSNVGPYWFDDLKQAYQYPSYNVANGTGRTIAIVIDSDVQDSDTAQYFGHEKLSPPTVTRRPVDGGPTTGFDPNNSSSDEASLDVQQAGGSAPGAHIVLYDVPQLSDQAVSDAYQAIVDDNVADVVNSSFGLCELYYTAAYNNGTDFTNLLEAEHDIFRQGNAQGITFVASTGDAGAYECTDAAFTKFTIGVSSPADDTDVTAVGGTNLITASKAKSLDSSYVRESEFFDTFDPAQGAAPNEIWGSGGGISTIFPKPYYQYLVNTGAKSRTIPDIAMHMGGCPLGSLQPCNPDDSAVIAVIGGQYAGLIGTSASSPEFAGLLAVTESRLGTRLGNANAYIYALAAADPGTFYRRNIPGNNGYASTSGYDLITGNGTPRAAAFALAIGAPLAGKPQTPSNP